MKSSKVIRRRRGVLAALVLLSIILLTAYFGESTGGTFHSMQRGAIEVLAPIQEGANRALKPFRDLVHWVGDTWSAKGERDKLKAERDRLRKDLTGFRIANNENAQMRRLLELDESRTLQAFEQVTGRVIGRSPNLWFATIEINKGTTSGVRVGQPVINGEGLVGKVKAVSRRSAVIALLTDPSFGVSAQASHSREPGTLTPAVGASGTMIFDLVPHAGDVRKGELISTAGTSSSRLPSLFPKGILIGRVTKVDEGDGELDRKIHVTPVADLRRLDFVQVLTKP